MTGQMGHELMPVDCPRHAVYQRQRIGH